MKKNDFKYNQLYTNQQIEEYLVTLGKHANNYHKQDPKNSFAVCILDGGFMFYANALKYFAFDIKTDFVNASSYSGTTREECKISKSNFHHPDDIANSRIYIFDDIIDSGQTSIDICNFYGEYYDTSNVEFVLCSLFRRSTTPIEKLEQYYSQIWTGFVNDDWLVGFGMDNPDGFMRQFPGIFSMVKL